MIKKMFRKINLVATTLFVSTSAMATDTFSALNQSGASSKAATISTIHSWMWITGITPVLAMLATGAAMYKYLSTKEAQGGGQEQPSHTKWFKIIGAGVVGIFAMFLFWGIVGKVFLNIGFSTAWQDFVTNVWTSLLTSPTS